MPHLLVGIFTLTNANLLLGVEPPTESQLCQTCTYKSLCLLLILLRGLGLLGGG